VRKTHLTLTRRRGERLYVRVAGREVEILVAKTEANRVVLVVGSDEDSEIWREELDPRRTNQAEAAQ
jgi:sRNA-binding carbon storage regulator CsrA